jgi:hypothetical protein
MRNPSSRNDTKSFGAATDWTPLTFTALQPRNESFGFSRETERLRNFKSEPSSVSTRMTSAFRKTRLGGTKHSNTEQFDERLGGGFAVSGLRVGHLRRIPTLSLAKESREHVS